MVRISYSNDEYYHIYNRGVEKRKTFLTNTDYTRFLFILNAFNTIGSTKNLAQTYKLKQFKQGPTSLKLVKVIDYCLMPNHFHLLLQQIMDGGVSKFLQRIGTGHTMYFNTKYNRTGVLFQGRNKAKHVNSDPYFNWLKLYIHLNPLDLFIPNWKESGIPNGKVKKAIDFLNRYKWVSCNDYTQYEDFLKEWEPRPDWQED